MNAASMSLQTMRGYLRLYLKNWRKIKFVKEKVDHYAIVCKEKH